MDVSGWVEKPFWYQLKEFEEYSYEKDDNLVSQYDKLNKLGKIKAPKMERLIKRSGSQIWQFNMRLNKQEKNGTAEYIRSYALFAEKTLKLTTMVDRIKLLYFKIKCYFMNIRSKICF